MAEKWFDVGDPVSKVGGDYRFDGIVVAAFPKLSGARRYVVEDDRGCLHIYSGRCLALVDGEGHLPVVPGKSRLADLVAEVERLGLRVDELEAAADREDTYRAEQSEREG